LQQGLAFEKNIAYNPKLVPCLFYCFRVSTPIYYADTNKNATATVEDITAADSIA